MIKLFLILHLSRIFCSPRNSLVAETDNYSEGRKCDSCPCGMTWSRGQNVHKIITGLDYIICDETELKPNMILHVPPAGQFKTYELEVEVKVRSWATDSWRNILTVGRDRKGATEGGERKQLTSRSRYFPG